MVKEGFMGRVGELDRCKTDTWSSGGEWRKEGKQENTGRGSNGMDTGEAEDSREVALL